mgnify:CR=1 FL=1
MPPTDMKIANIEWKEVESSTVHSIAYDQLGKVIYVQFQRGAIYRYENCGQELWSAMNDAASIGSFIHNDMAGHKYSEVLAP